jgi:hypothetical protein
MAEKAHGRRQEKNEIKRFTGPFRDLSAGVGSFGRDQPPHPKPRSRRSHSTIL